MNEAEQRKALEQGTKNSRARVTIIIVCAFVAAVLAGSFMQMSYKANAATAAATAKAERAVISIEGMSCTNCAKGIKAMLKRTAGVISAEVSFERREAVVDYDPERTTREKILQVIDNMGYKASPKESTLAAIQNCPCDHAK